MRNPCYLKRNDLDNRRNQWKSEMIGKHLKPGDKGIVNGVEWEVGSGNVFADLGLPEPELLAAKSRLAMQINNLIEKRGWTQAKAASELETSQPTISLLSRGRLRSITCDRLIGWLLILKQDIRIEVSPARRGPRLKVAVAAGA